MHLLQGQKKLLKPLLLFNQLISLSVYGLVRLLFYEYPIAAREEAELLVRAIAFGTLFTLVQYGLAVLHGVLKKCIRTVKLPTLYSLRYALAILIVSAIVFTSCESQSMGVVKNTGGKRESMGVKTDNTTGLQAVYKNMEPKTIRLGMNGETLNHTDIPIGEEFIIYNEGVQGLVQKEGKVSVGCALHITDSKGNTLLQAEDLFKGAGVYDATNATYLKCTVSTGKPMQWEEKYKVQATFWDKYGDGRIANTVTIRAIDMP
jgi:hypothetical protein